MTAKEARLHLRYSTWTSRRLVDAAAALPEEHRQRPMGVSHESVLKTLGHIHFADRIWYARIKDPFLPMPGIDALSKLEALTGEWSSIQQKWEAWSDSLTDADLSKAIEYQTSNGVAQETPVWQIVMHVVNHATLHRGQVMAMLRQLGAKPPGTDLIFYYRELGAAASTAT